MFDTQGTVSWQRSEGQMDKSRSTNYFLSEHPNLKLQPHPPLNYCLGNRTIILS